MAIEESDIKRLDERYVQKDACTEKMNESDHRMDGMQRDMAVLNVKLTWLIGILVTIAVPVLSIAIKYLFGGK